MVINVDVSNSCFWQETRFDQLAWQISGASDRQGMMGMCYAPQGYPDKEPPLYQALKRLRLNKFHTKYRGQLDGEFLSSVASVDTHLTLEQPAQNIRSKRYPR